MKKVTVMMLLSVIVLTIACTAFAAVKDDKVDPLYLNTRRVSASLSIGDSGEAKCGGYVKANNAQSSIKMTITLYKKSGTRWSKVTSWSASDTALILEINKTKQVSEGTYKVVLTGSVTNSEGKKESVTETSSIITYSK